VYIYLNIIRPFWNNGGMDGVYTTAFHVLTMGAAESLTLACLFALSHNFASSFLLYSHYCTVWWLLVVWCTVLYSGLNHYRETCILLTITGYNHFTHSRSLLSFFLQTKQHKTNHTVSSPLNIIYKEIIII
jgi:hypothetical protein